MRTQAHKNSQQPLSGSPAQILWARQLMGQLARQRAQAEHACECLSATRSGSDAHALAKWYLSHALRHQRRAAWWIANREYLLAPWFIEEYLRAHRPGAHAMPEEEARAAAWREALLYPEPVRFRGAVEVHALPCDAAETQGQLLLKYEMNPELSRVARNAKFAWNPNRGAYAREIDECSSPLLERAAETCAKLLAAGFRVLVPDARVRKMAVSGDYTREYPRWIRRGRDAFTLELLYEHDPWLHERARSLGARWSGRAMELNWMMSEEAREFAQLYNFRITKSAEEILSRWDTTVKNAWLWAGVEGVSPGPPAGDPLADKLLERVQIPEDLRDDDG